MLRKFKCYVCDEEDCNSSADTSNSTVCETAILCWKSMVREPDGTTRVSRGCIQNQDQMLLYCNRHLSSGNHASANSRPGGGSFRTKCCYEELCNGGPFLTFVGDTSWFQMKDPVTITLVVLVPILILSFIIGMIVYLYYPHHRNDQSRPTSQYKAIMVSELRPPNFTCSSIKFSADIQLKFSSEHLAVLPMGESTLKKIWDAYPTPESISIPHEEQYHWASLRYYEFDRPIRGQRFHCKSRVITVDGYSNPNLDSDRFSLSNLNPYGSLSNSNQYDIVEKTRRQIGRGIKLHYVNGIILVEVHCEHSVFIQSKSCNKQNNLNLRSVIELPSGTTFKAFDNAYFKYLLEEGVKRGSFEEISNEVYNELITMCIIRISFVEGWGANYHRDDATDTPCWIEIQLNGPLKWLDMVLNNMGSPMGSKRK